MTDYEKKQERMEKAKEIALAATGAVGALAWTIAQNVIIYRSTRAANDFFDDQQNKNKEEQRKANYERDESRKQAEFARARKQAEFAREQERKQAAFALEQELKRLEAEQRAKAQNK